MEELLRYLDEIVEPTIKDFEAQPTSVRHAFLACAAVFHGIDYLAYHRKRSSALRQRFKSQSPAFKIVDDVAHAFRHVTAGNRQKPNLKALLRSMANRAAGVCRAGAIRQEGSHLMATVTSIYWKSLRPQGTSYARKQSCRHSSVGRSHASDAPNARMAAMAIEATTATNRAPRTLIIDT
jgi:hypothetical protein